MISTPAADATAEAREQIARALTTFSGWQLHSNPMSAADAFLLAVPAVAEAFAAIERVRALADELGEESMTRPVIERAVASLRIYRALDGER